MGVYGAPKWNAQRLKDTVISLWGSKNHFHVFPTCKRCLCQVGEPLWKGPKKIEVCHSKFLDVQDYVNDWLIFLLMVIVVFCNYMMNLYGEIIFICSVTLKRVPKVTILVFWVIGPTFKIKQVIDFLKSMLFVELLWILCRLSIFCKRCGLSFASQICHCFFLKIDLDFR